MSPPLLFISLFISLLSLIGIVLSMSFNSLFLLINKFISITDFLSLSLLWLCVGIILALLSSAVTSSKNIMWWWLIFALIMSFISSNFFQFYIFFEMSLIPIMVMILCFGGQPERLSAGSYLLFYTTIISVPYLIIILMMGFIENSVHNHSWIFQGMLMILLMPFFIKMPIFSFHFWLPKAHVEASTSGSMVLAGMLLKLGSYGGIRIVCIFSAKNSISSLSSLWIILALLSSAVTFLQSDVKKLVAYSSVTHMTFMVVGLLSMSNLAFVSVVMVSLSHGWASMGMFLMAGTLSHSTSSRLGTLMAMEASLVWLIILFSVILISNAGIPPMPSFFPELFMVMSSVSFSGYSCMIFILMSLIVCYYNAYLFLWISHMKSSIMSSGKTSMLEGMILFLLVMMSLISLMWLQLF